MSFDFGIIQEYWQLILSGIPIILLIAFICAILGTVIGLLCTLLRKTFKFYCIFYFTDNKIKHKTNSSIQKHIEQIPFVIKRLDVIGRRKK